MTDDTQQTDSALKTPHDPDRDSGRAPPMTAREEWIDFLKTAFLAVLLALVIRTFLFEPFNIPSGSMKPTLLVGDYLFVYKPSYGYSKFSFPFGIAPFEGRVFTRGHLPQRGDVVVFRLPTNTSIDYIKRVIGLPGDTIQVRQGQLYINGKAVPRESVGLKQVDENGREMTVTEYIETLPNGVMHQIWEEGDDHPLDNTEIFKVPEGHYFMMGDNRDNSQDSRVQALVGYVPLENIVGKASMLFFSTNGSAGLAEIWKWPGAIRYNRIFNRIAPLAHKPETARAAAH
jgi:signal peptidase I